jgi:hypothetical protein
MTGAGSQLSTSGIILVNSSSPTDSLSTCNALGEDLWSPELGMASIQPSLDYLIYQGQAESSTRFRIASRGGRDRVIDASGQVSSLGDEPALQAICTQTAPYTNSTHTDRDEKWRVAVRSNNETIIGLGRLDTCLNE